jgi:hypothetical protein
VVETDTLTLDRMAIEEAGPNPDALAAAIHAQLKLKNGAVPVHAIARALDIISIRDAPLPGVEGALIMPANRDWGAIFTKAHTTPQRRRYTIGHELGHFLNLWHEPPEDVGFACTAKDLGTEWRGVSRDAGQHRLQESQANRFAIELLAPASRVEPFLKAPTLSRSSPSPQISTSARRPRPADTSSYSSGPSPSCSGMSELFATSTATPLSRRFVVAKEIPYPPAKLRLIKLVLPAICKASLETGLLTRPRASC